MKKRSQSKQKECSQKQITDTKCSERADTFYLDAYLRNNQLDVILFQIGKQNKRKYHIVCKEHVQTIFKALNRQVNPPDELLNYQFGSIIKNSEQTSYKIEKNGIITVYATDKKTKKEIELIPDGDTSQGDFKLNLTSLEQELIDLRLKSDIKIKELQKQPLDYKKKYQESLFTIQMQKQENGKLFDIIVNKQTEIKRLQLANKASLQHKGNQQNNKNGLLKQKDQQIIRLRQQLQKYKKGQQARPYMNNFNNQMRNRGLY